MAHAWKSPNDLSKIGEGITLLVTKVPIRGHAIVRFMGKDEPSEEERAAIQFANACLPFDPMIEEIRYRGTAKILIVPLNVVKAYESFGFTLKNVALPHMDI